MGIYITRWSAKRLREIANTVKGKKRDVISKSSFGDLLHISPLPPPPEVLVDFIVMRIDTKKRLLKLTDRKKISLTRDLVKKIFNVPSGSRPLEFGKRGKADFCEIYLEGERAPIPTTVSVLSNADDDDEDTIDRTWILLCLSSTTPYATTKFLSYIEQVAQLPNIASVSAIENPVNRDADGAEQPTESDTNEADGRARNVHEPPPKNMGGGDDVCGSLEDWLHPLPTFEDSELPPHMRAIFNKHKDIHAAELKDVTFDVPAAPAPATCNATARDSSPQQQKQLAILGTANASCEYFISAAA
ncbi:hypothetical protein ZWY2020_002569 [Hordeum vulgare]|nr:hypothetical protein ZWY2020_002569 [Hordeum vulgare]